MVGSGSASLRENRFPVPARGIGRTLSITNQIFTNFSAAACRLLVVSCMHDLQSLRAWPLYSYPALCRSLGRLPPHCELLLRPTPPRTTESDQFLCKYPGDLLSPNIPHKSSATRNKTPQIPPPLSSLTPIPTERSTSALEIYSLCSPPITAQ